jgi:hypothetical protein
MKDRLLYTLRKRGDRVIYILIGIMAGSLGGTIALYSGLYLPYVAVPIIGLSGSLASIIVNKIGRGKGMGISITSE